MSGQTPPTPPVPPLPAAQPPYPQQQPQPPYPQPQYGQPPYGQQPHPQQPYGQPPQPGYGATQPTAPYGAYAAPYTAPVASQYAGAVEARPQTSNLLGVVALIAAVIAFVVTPVLAALGGWPVGLELGRQVVYMPTDAATSGFDPNAFDDLSFLSPVRGDVLLVEIAFWSGTVLGIWAIVQGIVAIVKRRGRGLGIAAVVVAVIAPIVFGIVLYSVLIAGAAAGASIGG